MNATELQLSVELWGLRHLLVVHADLSVRLRLLAFERARAMVGDEGDEAVRLLLGPLPALAERERAVLASDPWRVQAWATARNEARAFLDRHECYGIRAMRETGAFVEPLDRDERGEPS